MTEVPPVRREIVVPAPAAVAFDVFTHCVGSWWPVASHSVHGAAATVAFVDGVIVESAPGEPDRTWGTVLASEPPARLSFTWHPGRGPERASRVDVTFEPVDGGTAVRLVHSQWEAFADPAAAREEYDTGWPIVLGRYADAFPVAAWTWVMVLHRATVGADVFSDPRFALHAAFLDRMADAGYLVAAGPLADEPGAGATVLRLPGGDRLAAATLLATTADQSVVQGLFTVAVRPWSVVTTGTVG